MSDDDASQGESLEEGTRRANSNLQRLLEAIGGALAVSGELLVRLQRILSGTEAPTGGTSGAAGPDAPGPDDGDR